MASNLPPNKPSAPVLVQDILTEFQDVFPEKLPPGLPRRRDVDHKIELEANAKAPVNRMYKMSFTELDELKKQFAELVDAGYVEPSKSPFGAPKEGRWDAYVRGLSRTQQINNQK